MSATLQRLSEARYFLSKLVQAYSAEREHYLNAFIKSSRSVTWIMKHEFHDVLGWKEWYDSIEASLEDLELMKFFNTLRVQSEKIGPVNETQGRRLVQMERQHRCNHDFSDCLTSGWSRPLLLSRFLLVVNTWG